RNAPSTLNPIALNKSLLNLGEANFVWHGYFARCHLAASPTVSCDVNAPKHLLRQLQLVFPPIFSDDDSHSVVPNSLTPTPGICFVTFHGLAASRITA